MSLCAGAVSGASAPGMPTDTQGCRSKLGHKVDGAAGLFKVGIHAELKGRDVVVVANMCVGMEVIVVVGKMGTAIRVPGAAVVVVCLAFEIVRLTVYWGVQGNSL
jgi:hypothetical protein